VNKVVMMPAEQYQVVQACFAAVSPVFYVMSIDKPRVGTAWEATSLVPNA
jgi:hypothetical protein